MPPDLASAECCVRARRGAISLDRTLQALDQVLDYVQQYKAADALPNMTLVTCIAMTLCDTLPGLRSRRYSCCEMGLSDFDLFAPSSVRSLQGMVFVSASQESFFYLA